MTVKLKWQPRVLGDGQRIYRSATPFTKDALPAVLATLPPDATEYLDQVPLPGGGYYRIGAFSGTPEVTAISEMVFSSGVGSQPVTPASPIPAKRHWRIRVLANQSGGSVAAISAAEIELRETIGGPDMTGSGVATAYITSEGTPDNLFDNDPNTVWVAPNFDYGKHWFAYDFGEGNAVSVGEINWVKRPDVYGPPEAPTFFVVECSDDGVTWEEIWSVTTPATWGAGAEARTFTHPFFTSPAKRHWRVRILENQSGGTVYAVSAAEIELRAESGGADLTGSGVASASYTHEGTPANLFDNDPNTLWVAPNHSDGNHWFAYDFGAGVSREVGAINWTTRPDFYGPPEAVTHGQVESSPDGIVWAKEWEFTTPATWGTGLETREFVKP